MGRDTELRLSQEAGLAQTGAMRQAIATAGSGEKCSQRTPMKDTVRTPKGTPSSSGPSFHIKSVKWKGHLKRLTLEPGPLMLDVPLSACVTQGDEVCIEAGDAWVIGKNGDCQFLQPYVVSDTIRLGGVQQEVLVKEITEEEEDTAYRALADYHYRGKSIHGRTARLVIRTFHPGYPKVIGYVELATPFFMNKPRSRVLDTTFLCGDIAWDRWDMATLRKYIHVIVRIARVVVAPEFRGADVGQLLVRHAAEFARDRWQVAGYRPYFLEISADMLKFVPFAERAGMTYVGETEGNLARVAKDMSYLLGRFGEDSTGKAEFEEISGILDQQIARMDRSIKLMKQEEIDVNGLVERLRHLSRKSVLRHLALFHGIVSLPKPHYMLGLTPEPSRFLESRVKHLGISNGHRPPDIAIAAMSSPIVFDNITIRYHSTVRRTYRTHAVQQAFEISPDDVRVTVLKGFSLTIEPGKVILIIGPSGSGKTTLLQLLAKGVRNPAMRVEGELELPSNLRAAAFEPIRSRRPLIEAIGEKDVRSALYLLGLAGLSEPILYLKRFEELSRGQQYRATLAKLIAARCNVWIADEFCTNLDPATASVVAENVQKAARSMGVTVLVAAPHCENFLQSLCPDVVVLLSTSWDHSILLGQQYIKLTNDRNENRGNVPRILVWSSLLVAVKTGIKRATVRKGRRFIKPGLLLLSDGHESVPVRVLSSTCKRFSHLSEEDAQAEGLMSVPELKRALHSRYPGIRDRSLVTVIYFERLWKTSNT